MRIREVADKLKMTTRTIRFYEEKGLLSPPKREANQYRSYTERDIWRLQTITALREIGMSLAHIKTALSEYESGNKEELLHDLELQRSAMAAAWLEYKQHMVTIDRMIALLKEDREPSLDEVFVLADGSKRLRELRSTWSDRWGFDVLASEHDELVLSDMELYEHYDDVLDTVVRWIHPQPGESGLDLGAGTGNLSVRLMERGARMTAVDQSKEMLRICRSKHAELDTKLGNMLAVPCLDQTFDFTVTSFALHHLTDEQQLLALEEMRRVLKPRGRLCIADVMMEDEESRERCIRQLRGEGKHRLLQAFERKFPAKADRLTGMLEANGYMTKQKQLTETLHIICAIPMR